MKHALFMILALMLVAACTSSTIVCQDGSVVENPTDCPVEEPTPAATVEEPAAPTEEPAAPVVAPPVPNEELLALLEKARGVRSYSFGWAPIEESSGQMVTIQQRKYWIRGERARVEIPLPNQYDAAAFVPIAYLDFAAESAVGWCTIDEIRDCAREGETRTASYDAYAITLPEEWIGEIPADAPLRDGPTFFGRPTQVAEYEREGGHYQVFLDDFFGMPVRIGIYDGADYERLAGGVEYQGMAFNRVTEEDVTLPE